MKPSTILVTLLLVGPGLVGPRLVRSAMGDWPEFRGPARNGVTIQTALPMRWSSSENVRWRAELPGQGWSSPVVVGNSIFVTTAIANDPDAVSPSYQLCLLILDAKTGAMTKNVTLFVEPASAPGIHKKNSHASPTALYDGTNLYLHFGHQGTACCTLAGDVVWKNDSLAYPPVHGNGGSPVVVDNLLIFARDGADISEVTALDKHTGSVVWQAQRNVEVQKKFSFCTPLLLELNGRRQLILPGSNVVQSLDPATGGEHWRLRYDGYSVIPRPIYESGLVFVCTGYNTPSILAIDPNGQGDVTDTHLVWRSDSNIPHTPSLIALEGKIAMVSDRGIAQCFSAKTGGELWMERVGGNFSASPLLAGSHIYFLSEEGECSIYDMADTPKKVAKNLLGERCLASFAVIDHDLLLRSDQALYRISE